MLCPKLFQTLAIPLLCWWRKLEYSLRSTNLLQKRWQSLSIKIKVKSTTSWAWTHNLRVDRLVITQEHIYWRDLTLPNCSRFYRRVIGNKDSIRKRTCVKSVLAIILILSDNINKMSFKLVLQWCQCIKLVFCHFKFVKMAFILSQNGTECKQGNKKMASIAIPNSKTL